MKRCPECLFIYPETDTRCDFDNTALVVLDDVEIEAATQAPAASSTKKSSKKSKRTTKKRGSKIAAVLLLIVSVVGFGAYSLKVRNQKRVAAAAVASVREQRVEPRAPQIVVASTPAETASPSPSPSPSATPKETPERVATSHSRTTAAPISTSGPGMGKKAGGKPVILLSSGGKIDADEVWRTRDGVWYRRNGIVTLLKHNRVKAITTH
jgi:hypothetical protein